MIDNKTYLTVQDHSVSGEEFKLLFDSHLDLLQTSPQPSLEKLPEYYKSEDYISHTNTKRNVFEMAYHVVRKIALKRKLRLINSLAANERTLLDIGCGTGDFLELAKQNHWIVSGIEPNENARIISNRKVNNRVFKIDELLKFEPHSFDVITLWHVLEHLPKLEEHISIFKKLLKPKGTIVVAVPNYKSYDAVYYKNFWAAYDVPRHLWHFSKKSIKLLFSKEKMKVIKMYPMKFDSFYVSLLSEKYKSGRMNFFNAFKIGFLSNTKAKRSGEYSSLIYVIKNN